MLAEGSGGPAKAEILIIRRGGNEDNFAVKGGAWKIAYADFVTAMMAFFLVMWLINSANEATRARVASYFNPIKMTDSSPSGRGLSDPNPNKRAATAKEANSAEGEKSATTQGAKAGGQTEAQKREADLVSDPYTSLQKLASEGTHHPSGQINEVRSEKSGDPFDPQAWDALRAGNAATESADDGAPPVADAPASPHGATPSSAEDAARQKILQAAAEVGVAESLNITVRQTPEGLLITLGDKGNGSMFEIGSAAPTPQLVSLVESIGKLLEGEEGDVIIRGHTDARQYRNLRFDNWQLSTARAHMASYMLAQGGLSPKRIMRIEGYGDHAPLSGFDPMAPENRRVEFLLKK